MLVPIGGIPFLIRFEFECAHRHQRKYSVVRCARAVAASSMGTRASAFSSELVMASCARVQMGPKKQRFAGSPQGPDNVSLLSLTRPMRWKNFLDN